MSRSSACPRSARLLDRPNSTGQCPVNTSVWKGNTSAWSRNTNACTRASASTAWRATRFTVPVSGATITSWFPELARRDVVLHVGDHHRDDRKRLGHACDFGDHSGLHDLRLDLAEACLQASPPGALGDEEPGRTHDRGDDVAGPERELLHAPVHACADDRLIQLDLRLSQRGLGA